MRVRTSPSEVLQEEFMTPFRLTAKTVAQRLCIPISDLNALLNGSARVTPEMSFRLGHAFGTSSGFFLRLQQFHDAGDGAIVGFPEVVLPDDTIEEIMRSVRPFEERIFTS